MDDPFRLASRRFIPFRRELLEKKKKQMVEESELKWDCGDAYPEPALDQVPKSIVGVREAAAMLLAGLGVYVAVYQTALAVDKPSTQPFADKTFPFDGLKKELGR